MITFNDLGHQGQLGNQLFQISAAVGLALRNNDQYMFRPWKHEGDFNLHNCFSTDIAFKHTYTESGFEYKPIPYQPDLNLSGFFQSYMFWEDCKDKIFELLTPVYHFERELGLCSIHVRRGDYLRFADSHPQQVMSYYYKAIELSGCNKFLVFSDDIEWCKNNFKGNMFDFSEYMSPAVDMAMMAKKCEHNIIANSSFSLWGAMLNQSPNKKVMAPQNWFGPKLNKTHNTKDLLPKSWIKIGSA